MMYGVIDRPPYHSTDAEHTSPEYTKPLTRLTIIPKFCSLSVDPSPLHYYLAGHEPYAVLYAEHISLGEQRIGDNLESHTGIYFLDNL
jgi:hypothetical protein